MAKEFVRIYPAGWVLKSDLLRAVGGGGGGGNASFDGSESILDASGSQLATDGAATLVQFDTASQDDLGLAAQLPAGVIALTGPGLYVVAFVVGLDTSASTGDQRTAWLSVGDAGRAAQQFSPALYNTLENTSIGFSLSAVAVAKDADTTININCFVFQDSGDPLGIEYAEVIIQKAL